MIIIPDHSSIQNVMLMGTRIPPKISKGGGPKYGSRVGSSPITRLQVVEDLLDDFVWEFVRHLSCPPPMVICRINPEIRRNGIRD